MTEATGSAYLSTLRESASRDDLLREIERHLEEKAALRAETLEAFITDLMHFQLDTFGPIQTIAGVLDHVEKEIREEIRPDPTDNREWLGLMNLSVSAQRINGATPSEVVKGWTDLLAALKLRSWPNWRTADPDKAIEHHRNRSAAQPAAAGDPFVFVYINYKGEIGERRAIPLSVRFGSTEFHPEPQWLLRAFDVDKKAERDFAMKDMLVAAPPPPRSCPALPAAG